MPTFRQRCAISIVAVAIFATSGTLAGYYCAIWLFARVMQIKLDNYAHMLMTNGENSAAELRTALAAVDASPYRSCSDAEVQYFGALIHESEFLQDAGRMSEDGRIECSAKLGKSAGILPQARPDFTQQDGTTIYKNMAPYRGGSLEAVVMQRNRSFVVYTPLARMFLEPAPMHFTETATDAPTQQRGWLLGEPLNVSREILGVEGKDWRGENLYATRCSIRYFNCVTAFTSLPEIVQANRSKFAGCGVACGQLGALAGLIFAILYKRNQSLSKQLRRAIHRDKLHVLYQPIVDLDTGRITGAEALARWNDEEGLAVSPEVFVRLAEEHGFVCELTQLVVRHVMADFGLLLRRHPELTIALNVTAADLKNPEFEVMLETALACAGVTPHSLTIEMTESSAVRHENAIKTIHSLRRRGHQVHIDDFGTGYSSLSYLQDLAVDAIKIDRSFTQSIGTGSVTVAIVPQILAMARALDLRVVVEGVETVDQARYFAETRQSVMAQGWLFGRPMPAKMFQDTLAQCSKPTEEVAMESEAISAA